MIIPALYRTFKCSRMFCCTGDLAESIRKRTNMKFGVYHSQFEWFNPLWLQDKANNFSTQDFVNVSVLCLLCTLA